MRKPKVAVVIAARDEEGTIGRAIRAVKEQTLPPSQIIVVDDGSRDRTGQIAEEMGCQVVRLPRHEESWLGRPEFAEVFNAGLKHVEPDADYVLILGADTILPPNYIEELVRRVRGTDIVVASGRIEGQPFAETSPRGTGRLVDAKWWRSVVGELRYPAVWGWDTWLPAKALQMGYKVACFKDVVMRATRYATLSPKRAVLLGYAMRAVGYFWPYALDRCLTTFFNSPSSGIAMLVGWLTARVEELDIASWFREMQKKFFVRGGLLRKIRGLLKRAASIPSLLYWRKKR